MVSGSKTVPDRWHVLRDQNDATWVGTPQPDKLKAFELYGEAMACYAERREVRGADGKPVGVDNHITVEFVEPE